jgi:hypothetical protein
MNKKEEPQKKSYQKSSSIPFEIDQDVKNIDLKPIEKKRLDIVYEELSKLEQEASSDEDSLTKKYLKEVEKNANLKKMNKQDFNNNNSNNINSNNNNSIYNNKKNKKSKKDLKEEREENDNNKNKKPEIKISKKGLRKMLRLYTKKKYSPEEIEQMIWEVDEDMDNKVSKYEMEKMYKRCIIDKDELEPKKLFYFILFLMFDKENKRSINEEDTLELLRVRHRNDKEFNNAINEIFNPEGKKNYKGNIDDDQRLCYEDFVKTMMDLVLKKRDLVKDKRENYCNHINDDNSII